MLTNIATGLRRASIVVTVPWPIANRGVIRHTWPVTIDDADPAIAPAGEVPAGEVLAGGLANAGAVIRFGDVVERPAPANAAMVHGLFRALRAAGLDCVPEPLGLGGGRERLTFVEGRVALPPFPDWSTTDAVVASVGRLLRRFHDATRSLVLPSDAAWPSDLADPEGGEVWCHNDVCPENVVFVGDRAAALLDFDFAAPGRALWDVAQTARYWAPILDPESAAVSGRRHLDPAHRLRVLADAYGLDSAERSDLVSVIWAAERVARTFVAVRVDRGEPAFVASWAEHGRWARWDRKWSWLEANGARLTAALVG